MNCQLLIEEQFDRNFNQVTRFSEQQKCYYYYTLFSHCLRSSKTFEILYKQCRFLFTISPVFPTLTFFICLQYTKCLPLSYYRISLEATLCKAIPCKGEHSSVLCCVVFQTHFAYLTEHSFGDKFQISNFHVLMKGRLKLIKSCK